MTSMIPFNVRNKDLRTRRGDSFYNMIDSFFTDFPQRSMLNTFKIDIKEQDDMYLVEAELPGVKKEDIHLDVEKGILSISITQQENTEEQKDNYVHKERYTSSMSRRVYLGEVDELNLKAKLNDGILEISIPKKAPDMLKKTITIE